jgi:hypothetical protein
MFKLLNSPLQVIDHCLSYSSFVNAALSTYLSIYILVKEGVALDGVNSHMVTTIICVSMAFNLTTLFASWVYRLYSLTNHIPMLLLLLTETYAMGTSKYGSLVVLAIALFQMGGVFKDLAKILEPMVGLGPLPGFLRVCFVLAYIYIQWDNQRSRFLGARRVRGGSQGFLDLQNPDRQRMWAH